MFAMIVNEESGFSSPQAVCDVCGKVIKRGGNVFWENETGVQRIAIAHEKCSESSFVARLEGMNLPKFMYELNMNMEG